jgi:hypothetical protein
LSFNSLATGPKIRVALGSHLSSIITQALSSNLIKLPSERAISFAVLTIMAFTTFFFLIHPFGSAFFTATTMISQTLAYLL